MNEFIFVSTPLYLANDSSWKSKVLKPGYTPIFKNDLYKFELSLKSTAQKSQYPTAAAKALDNQTASIDSNEATKDHRGVKYQDIRLFLPISLSQQLHTLAIQNFPDNSVNISAFIDWLELFTIEKFSISNDQGPNPTHEVIENWSNVVVSTVENTQILFIRLSPLSQFSRIVLYWIKWFAETTDSVTTIHTDENTRRYIEASAPDYIPTIEKEDLDALNARLHELQTSTSETAPEVAGMIAYDVDMSTLSDLPRDSLNQLVKDIVEFRTRVLTMEKEKRTQEALEEGKRQQRFQLKQVLEQIRKRKGSTIVAGEGDDVDDEDDDVDDDDDDDGQDDFEIEKNRREKEKEKALKEYEATLSHLNSVIMPQLRSRDQRLSMLKDYKTKLQRERVFYLKEMLHLGNSEYYDHKRSFKEEEEHADEKDRAQTNAAVGTKTDDATQSENVGNTDNNFILPHDTDIKKQGYPKGTDSADNPGASSTAAIKEPIAKKRKIKLALKKVFDSRAQEADSETEEEEPFPVPLAPVSADTAASISSPSVSSLAVVTPIVTNAAAAAAASPSTASAPVPTPALTGPTNQLDTLPFQGTLLDAKLRLLRQSRLVDELVKEYLGVYEDELVEYIIENVREHRSHAALLSELQETFDDDSNQIVDDIWAKLLAS
ncbi:Snu71p Ecym_7350 [Eremothecium cymbalariae DBVPG|uniref:U1 small nuclear ribonucleoprotein component SNU71 n=1 Tax=Eremothecium cymbalariae (strain CBS 270.75 / DBVPG 7215 / KCTC 17166 / NRRL Y-17582) TaxID=931890 RepID=G8JWG4_ERECY|nr:hypothetical protein Ecym_7350 [Eremothecium cymbalariae DBVPG\